MSQLTRRLTYSIPLLIVAALLAVENTVDFPYVFDKGTGPISGAYFKVFKPESLRYNKAMLALAKGVPVLAAATPESRRPAAPYLREASKYLAEVNRSWAFEKVPKGLNGDDLDQLKRDLPAVASGVEGGTFAPESPEGKRLAKYFADAKTLLPNGAIL